MRLLYVSTDPGIPVLGHKGGSVHVRELASALARLGVDVTIASPRIGDEGDRDLHPGVRLCPIPAVVPRVESTVVELDEALGAQRAALHALGRAIRPDLVYERYALFSDSGVGLAAELDVPHTLEMNAPLRAEAARWRILPQPLLAEALERRVVQATNRILCVSHALAGTLGADLAGKVDVMPNAVAPERFTTRRRRPREAFVAGFAGSLKPWHGIECMLAACRQALAAEPRLRVEVVGDGPLMPLLRGAGLPPDRVRIFGAVDHEKATARMLRWDVGLAPYAAQPDFYFSPLKVLEYMAAGACAVASDLGQIPWLLGGGTRGVLVPPDDAAALTSAMVELARDPARAHRLGRDARRHVLANHTWADNARAVLAPARTARRSAA